MSMAQLVAAGAPELPEGWFYRVRESSLFWPEVEIREQRKRFGSRLIVGVWVAGDHFDDMGAAVVEACGRAYESAEERATSHAKYAALLKYYGDHDPKGGR
jgi:hypothetical protein